MNEVKKRFDELDGMKIFFALGVVFTHYYGWAGSLGNCPKLSAFVYQYGYLGVEFFFILSGFLMEHTYRNIVKDMSFVNFLKRRLKSIVPANLCAECLGIACRFLDWKFTQGLRWYQGVSVHPYDILLSFTMTGHGWVELHGTFNSPTWFLNVLMLCYILYFAVLRLSERAKVKALYLYIGVMLFAWWGFLQNGVCFPFLFSVSCRGYLCFFLGCILYRIQQSGVFAKAWRVLPLTLAFAFFMVCTKIGGVKRVFGNVQLSFIFFCFPVLILSVENLPCLKKAFSLKPFVWAGSYSMDIYLTHFVVNALVWIFNSYFGWNVNLASYKTLGVLLLCVFAFAFVWHIVVGKWFTPLFNKWFDRFTSVPQ